MRAESGRSAFGNARMEMHQVRYFLAVARTLNFTKAADECNVAQPSLTRAIKLLEGELGGDLFRRERPRAMLTPLGERMYPLLKQCYDSAQSARALAAMINDGEVGALKIAVSSSIELGLILNEVNELRRSFSEIELKILRGTGPQLVEYLKAGEAELAVAASIGEAWDRLDTWKLFDEPFDMVFSRSHRLASHETHRARGPQARTLPAAQPLRKGRRSRRAAARQRAQCRPSSRGLVGPGPAGAARGQYRDRLSAAHRERAAKPGADRGARASISAAPCASTASRAGSARRSPRPS